MELLKKFVVPVCNVLALQVARAQVGWAAGGNMEGVGGITAAVVWPGAVEAIEWPNLLGGGFLYNSKRKGHCI